MNKKLVNNKKEKLVFTGEQINKALFWIDDTLDRSQIPYLLGGDLARQLFDNDDAGKEIIADKIELITHERYVTKDTFGLLKTFIPWLELDKKILLEYEGVPIEIKVLKRKYKFFSNPDLRFYMRDEYQVPNPFNNYWKARFIIQ